MLQYKNKKAKKPYDKCTSASNSKRLDTGVQESSKDSEKVDSFQPLQAESCSQCRDTSRGLLQCECCDLWHCGGCCGIPEQTMNVISEVDSLHFLFTM